MSSNKSARQELERLFGKKCMIEELGIRYIPKKERRKIKGYTKYDECLTFHHIKEKHNGGKATAENGALVKGYNHRWLHSLPDHQKEQINEAIQQYKLSILARRLETDGNGQVREYTEEIPLDFDPADFIEIPVFDTEERPQKKKFNRAKAKREFQRQVDEALYLMEEDEMSRIVDPRDMMITRLHNVVKGHAQSVLQDRSLTPEEKKEDFEVIEEFVHYVDGYYENQRKLAEYDRMKAEYLIDDGR